MTVGNVLQQVETLIKRGEKYPLWSVAKDLIIFEYHIDYLTQTHLKAMRQFLKEAEKLGYAGFVQFQIGNSWLPSGMWAYKGRTDNRNRAPEGEWLYRSFEPKNNHWEVQWKDGHIYPERDTYDSIKTAKEIEKLITELEKEAEILAGKAES